MGFRFLFASRRYVLLVFAFVFTTLGTGSVSLAAPQSSGRTANDSRLLRRMMIPGTEDVQLIVELSDPAILERLQAGDVSRQTRATRPLSARGRKMDFVTPEVLVHRQEINRTQESVKRKIEALPNARILGTTDTLVNAVLVRVPASQYRVIRRLAGVKKVYFSRPKRMLLDAAAAIQNAQNLWTMAGGQSKAGQGIKIGIIDSGIDITNPMFSGAGMTAPPGFTPRPDGAGILDPARMNKKVIVARSYVAFLGPQRVQTAEDEVGHGTFVAGCAAGAPVNAPLASISGMAPGAYLGNYKIIGTPGINDSTTSAAETKAIDDAVADGMDVINLSIGALDYLPPEEDAEYQYIVRALQAGVVVTVAAGNEGPMTQTISSPAVIPGVIAVGSVSNSREFLPVIHTTIPNLNTIGYKPSADGIQVASDMPLAKAVDVASLDGNGLGCSAFPTGSLLNSVALVARGTCLFADKVNNAAKAGATSVVVYNNVPNGLDAMGGLSAATVPAVMISNADGIVLKQHIQSNPTQVQVGIGSATELNPVVTPGRALSSFSSIGPGTDFSIKPDMVAVGGSVYSATETTRPSGPMYDATGFRVSSGTSFSAPMVAGAAAGLMQRFPALGAFAIKSLLTTTASRNLTLDGVNPTNVLQSGSGLLNMGDAMAAGAVFSPTSLNFGVHSYSGTLSLSAILTVQNISSSADQFTFGVEPIVAGPTVNFSTNSTGFVAPGASIDVEIRLQVAAPATGGFQGFITARSASSSFVYRIPYWAGLYVPNPARILKISKGTSGNGFYSDLPEAIAAAQPGNVIEIQDSSVYSPGNAGYRVSTSGAGLPLHGITIRAASGETPVIGATSIGTGIQVIGLKNVLFQGLQVRGGYTGIQLWQPSASVPLSVTIDQCNITDAAGDFGATGIYVDGGGTIEITRSTIQNSTGPGVSAGFLAAGTQLTVTGSTFRANGFDGLDAYDADIYVTNSTFSGNGGAGVYAEHCTGALTGNTFSQNQDILSSFGDGLQIADGSMTLKNNLFDSNADAGIALFSWGMGTTAQIIGNKIRGNGDYGLYSSPAMRVIADGNLIEDNAGGVYLDETMDALLTNNIIVRSMDALIGDGVEISGQTNARLVNNTIYQNALHGVLLSSGTVSVANSIISSNGGGNLSGVDANSVQSSLAIANPKFVNPDLDDFSLAPDSPAIDAGSNIIADLPFLDYNGHLRVTSAANLIGEGKVDIGAVESSSAYPLIYPLILNGSEPAIGGVFTTGVAFSNPGNTGAQFSFTAYSGTGGMLAGTSNPFRNTLVPYGQLAILDYQMFGFDSAAPVRGGVLGASDSSNAGFALFVDPGFRKFATGANASTRLTNDVVFMRHQSGSGRTASYIVFNPGINTANITANLQSPDGSPVAQQTAVVPAKGHTLLQFNSGVPIGYVTVKSDRPVSGIELVGNDNLMAALGGFAPSTQARLFFPHFAVGGNYSTQVGIINRNESAATTLTLSAYDDSGSPIGELGSLTLQPGEQLLKTVTELFGISANGPLRTGYLVAQSDQAGIMGFTDFSYNDGTAGSDATIPADSVPSRNLLFSHIANGVPAGSGVPYQTGIALLNPFGTAVQYTMSVYDGNGTLRAQATQTIGPRQKVAKILSHPVQGVGFFTQDLALGNGHVEVTTGYGLLGLELFFTEDVSQLASVPAQVRE